jgi:predicted dithiol-disulfide oxidoreductase (DUF899 family)
MYGHTEIQKKIQDKYDELTALRKEQVALSKSEGLKEVENYSFRDKDGGLITLFDMFQHHDELIVVHNMGKSCPYCTLWADGLSSSTPHIQNRCGFALVSPNDYQTMSEFAANRDWKFPYYSGAETNFISDMGFSFQTEDGKTRYTPGYTTFVKKEDKIYRVACDLFGPGDFYSPIWPMMDMLHNSDKEWHPRVNYE